MGFSRASALKRINFTGAAYRVRPDRNNFCSPTGERRKFIVGVPA
jgi:hypothetical protein